MMPRSQKRFALIWCVFILLQQCDVILAQNISDMRTHQTVNVDGERKTTKDLKFHKVGTKDDHAVPPPQRKEKNHIVDSLENLNLDDSPSLDEANRDRRAIGDEASVTRAIRTTAHKIHEKDANATQKISTWIPSCDSKEESNLKTFWEAQKMLYPTYLIFSSVSYHIIECHTTVEKRVKELVQLLDYDEIVSFLDELSSDDLEFLHKAGGSDDIPGSADEMVDPEGPENAETTAAAEIVASNFGRVQEMNHVIDQLQNHDNAAQFSRAGLDEFLEDMIMEYDTVSNMLLQQGSQDNSRKKRHVFTKKESNTFPGHKDSILALKKSKLQEHPLMINVKPDLMYSNIMKNVAKTLTEHKRLYENAQYEKALHHIRSRRSVTLINREDLNFFAVQDSKSCRVLTPDDDAASGTRVILADIDYDAITDQLWYRYNDFIVHATRDLFLTLDQNGLLTLDDVRTDENQRWELHDNVLMGLDDDFELVPGESSDDVLAARTNSNLKGTWNFTKMTEEGLVSCSAREKKFFVIQHKEKQCETLCASDDLPSSSSINYFMPVIISSFVAIAGITMSVVSYKLIESKRLAMGVCMIGMFLSVTISAAIALIPIMAPSGDKATNPKKINLLFKNYDQENPDSCSWYEEKLYQYFVNVKFENVIVFKDQHNIDKVGQEHLKKLNKYENTTWVFDGAEIMRFGGKKKDNDKSNEIRLKREVTNKTDSWRKISLDSPTFFEDITCLYVLAPQTSAQTMSPKCEEFPWLFQDDLLFNNLWYYGGYKTMKNVVQNSSTISLSQNDVKPLELTGIQTECRRELFFIQNKDLPCEVLTYESDDLRSPDEITFSVFDFDKMLNQLWILRDNKLIHFRSGGQMAVSGNSSSVSLGQFGDQWRQENQTIVSSNQKCHLRLSTESESRSATRRLECSTNSGTNSSNWEFVQFDSEYLDKLICVYFIQNQLAPCESLTGDPSTKEVKMAPVLVDTLESQLWYMLNKTIYHLETGLAVGKKQDDASLSLIEPGFENNIVLNWNYLNASLLNSNNLDELLAVNTYNGHVYVKRTQDEETEKWEFLESQTAMHNQEQLSCSSSHAREYFFVKLSSKPCDLLTAGRKLEPPTFVPFEEEKMSLQLWYWEFGHLINLETGYSLQINTPIGNESPMVILADTFAYRRSQLISRRDDSIFSMDNGCRLGVKNSDTSQLVCSNHLTNADSKWHFLPHEQALDDISELVCIYFIRNNHKYCEFLTGYDEGNSLKARPLLPELVERQLFFWKRHNLVNLRTDLPLAISNSHDKVILQDNENTGGWEFIDNHLVSTEGSPTKYLTVDIHQDGVVKALPYSGDLTKSWSLFEMRKVFKDPTIADCPTYQHRTKPKRFFIKHTSKPCLVLTSSDLGHPPVFKVFDKHEMQKQLWTFENNHIINEESGLALMLDNEQIHSNRVAIMWHVYEYSRLQIWGTNERSRDYFSIHDHNTDMRYYLSPFDDAEVPTVIGKTNKVGGQWHTIEKDEDFKFYDEITCHFFLKNPLAPCELLTGQGRGERIVVRPVREDLVTHQLWTFEGKKIRNVGSGLYLTWYRGYIILKDKEGGYFQNWRYASRQLIHDHYNTIVGIEQGTGHIVLERRISSRYPAVNARRQWIKVDKQEGIGNPEKLTCRSQENPEVYVIRSEHRDCPVLTDIGNQAGVRAVESPDESNIWIRLGHHIINSKTMKALSVQDGRHRVYMEKVISHHQTRQHWTWHGDKIKSKLKDSWNANKYLTYSSHYVQIANYKGTDEQKWVWNTLEAVQDDGKLLRCSRCYNKGEETAAEVIGYIPLFGWLYNLFRSVTYAIKDCPKVALDAFKSFAIDVLIDIAVVLSMGAVSAIAYGVKTAVTVGVKLGIKAGIKAGVKAGFKATKSMIKLSIKAAKTGFKNLIKNGITKTLKLKLNMMMSATKMTLKAGAKVLKKTPSILKSFTQRALRGSKKVFSKTVSKLKSILKKSKWTKSKLRSMPSMLKTKLKHLPKNMKLRFRKVGHSISKSLKKVGNMLSKKAENAVNKVDDLKKTKKMIRCRRSPLICKNTANLHNVLKKPNKDAEDMLTNLRDNFQMRDGDQFTQRAAIVSKNSEVDSSYLDDLNSHHTNRIQTETDLLKNYENTQRFKDCKDLKLTDCQFFLYSYKNPCSIRDNCADLLRKTCKKWFNDFKIKCIIGFTEYNGDDHMKQFMDQLDNMNVKPKVRAEELAKKLDIKDKETVDKFLKVYNSGERPKWQLESELKKIQTNHDLLKNADESIEFYHIARNPDNIISDAFKLKTPNNEVKQMITKLQDSVPNKEGSFRQRAAMVIKKGDDEIENHKAYMSDLNKAQPGNVQHTEEYLLQHFENSPGFKSCKNSKKSNCQFFLYSYNSPCLRRGNTDSCTEILSKACKRWFSEFGMKCHIGFTDYYGDADTFQYIKDLNKREFRDTDTWVNAMAEKLGSADMKEEIFKLTTKDMTKQQLAVALKQIQTSHYLLRYTDESIDFYNVGSTVLNTRQHG